MNALPVNIAPSAADDIRALATELRPAVFEHLARIGANYENCSHATSFPRPPGLESGLWLKHRSGKSTLLEVLFYLNVEPDGLTVRRVLTTEIERLPDWVLRPDEWSAHPPWPLVDL